MIPARPEGLPRLGTRLRVHTAISRKPFFTVPKGAVLRVDRYDQDSTMTVNLAVCFCTNFVLPKAEPWNNSVLFDDRGGPLLDAIMAHCEMEED